jgi:phosphoribosylaminoimidazolecarboxamide formyltransferase/IMP cyclohydrolase
MKKSKNKKYALISVSNKKGIEKFAKELSKFGYKIVSTGGTAKALKKARVKNVGVSKLTGYPQMLGGRVKSLHPLIFGGILADRDNKDHLKDLKKFKLPVIDIVVCNLYPFKKTISKKKFTHQEAVEKIDIGGPSMVRAAAKNHKHVAIVVDPKDYSLVIREMKKNDGEIPISLREKLAFKAFNHTKEYDSYISGYFQKKVGETKLFPAKVEIGLTKVQDLRYGENPHQKAAFYRDNIYCDDGCLINARQLHGKELSYNNIMDTDAAWQIVSSFVDPAVAIIKHANPCGAAKDEKLYDAYVKAFESDPVSAFGSIVALNRTVDPKTAEKMTELFIEVIIAPHFDKTALKILKEKKNLRILELQKNFSFKGYDFRKISGGFLIQELDAAHLGMNEIKIPTSKHPSLGEMEDLFFAWAIIKFVKSNAIVLVKDGKTVGVGAGQMSRIDAARLALEKAGDRAKGAVLASDAFFPFRDCVDLAVKYGISAIIQPGGSIRDEESIKAADEHEISMVFTGRRHFRH